MCHVFRHCILALLYSCYTLLGVVMFLSSSNSCNSLQTANDLRLSVHIAGCCRVLVDSCLNSHKVI